MRLSNCSHETLTDDIELPHGTIDGRVSTANEIAGTLYDSKLSRVPVDDIDKQQLLKQTFVAEETTATSLEEVSL